MTTLLRRLVCGAAGASLIVALFLPWASVQSADRGGWELWKLTFPLCVLLAVCALATAITGGQFGLNRPDVSIIGATDLLGVVTTVTLAWLLFYELPAHASRQPALILALISAAAAAIAAADYGPLRGAPLFPRMVDQRTNRQPAQSRSKESVG